MILSLFETKYFKQQKNIFEVQSGINGNLHLESTASRLHNRKELRINNEKSHEYSTKWKWKLGYVVIRHYLSYLKPTARSSCRTASYTGIGLADGETVRAISAIVSAQKRQRETERNRERERERKREREKEREKGRKGMRHWYVPSW